MQQLRDEPACARRSSIEFSIGTNPGLVGRAELRSGGGRRRALHCKWNEAEIAVLREQASNGHIEMAAAFDRPDSMRTTFT